MSDPHPYEPRRAARSHIATLPCNVCGEAMAASLSGIAAHHRRGCSPVEDDTAGRVVLALAVLAVVVALLAVVMVGVAR